MQVKVEIADMALDPASNSPVMVLKEVEGSRTIPIWIGVAEASAIALHRSNTKPERPLTHDLIKLVIEGLNATLVKAVINDLRNNTFFAQLYIETGSAVAVIDSRPSDAVALAIRFDAPIFIEEAVFASGAKAGTEESGQESQKPNELRNNLRNLDPSDFGKFTL